MNFVAGARKFAVAVVTALSVLSVSLTDGMTSQEWIAVVVAFAGALGVYAVPNGVKNV